MNKPTLLGLVAVGGMAAFGLSYCGGDIDSSSTSTTGAEEAPLVVEAPASTSPAGAVDHQALVVADAAPRREPPPPLLPVPTQGVPAPPCTSCPPESPAPPIRIEKP